MNNKSKFNINSFMKIKIGKYVLLHIGTIVLFVSSIVFNYYTLFLIAYSSAFLHELGHILTAQKLNIPVKHIEIKPFGIMAKISDSYIKEPTKEIIISFAGPLTSMVLSVIFGILNMYFPNSYLEYVLKINIGLFAINLMPCLPLDGGRILKSMITEKYGIITAYNFMTKSSQVILLVLSIFCGALIMMLKFNFSFIMILAFLMGNIAVEYKTINLITMKEIIYNKQKLYENNINKVKSTVAYETMPARFILRNLSYNYYYIIDVIDKNQKIINTLTETQIIDGITNNGIWVLLKDIH